MLVMGPGLLLMSRRRRLRLLGSWMSCVGVAWPPPLGGWTSVSRPSMLAHALIMLLCRCVFGTVCGSVRHCQSFSRRITSRC